MLEARTLSGDYRLWLASTWRDELRRKDVYRDAEIVTADSASGNRDGSAT